jgi:hypothetical protein
MEFATSSGTVGSYDSTADEMAAESSRRRSDEAEVLDIVRNHPKPLASLSLKNENSLIVAKTK